MIGPASFINCEENMENPKTQHIPVMLNEVVELLKPSGNGIHVDCTLGLGGHAKAIGNLIGPGGRLIGIDRDGQALTVAKENLSSLSQQSEFVHDDFRNVDKILDTLGIRQIDTLLMDLGISSFQLDNPERGFSIRAEGPLDMRMDQEAYISAYDLINTLSEREISAILKDFGEERWHNRIARYVVTERNKAPISTTKELTDIILRAIPYKNKKEKIHPATRTFQAIRIAVNRELESLELALGKCIDALKIGGRIAVISFHSLEDRIVKDKFRALAQLGQLKLLTKKPLRPTEEEAAYNSRARSARLRVAQRI